MKCLITVLTFMLSVEIMFSVKRNNLIYLYIQNFIEIIKLAEDHLKCKCLLFKNQNLIIKYLSLYIRCTKKF